MTGNGKMSTAKRVGIVTALLLMSGLTSAFAQVPPRPVMVEDVQVSGNQFVSTQRILNSVKTRPGKLYNQAKVEEDVRHLSTLGPFRSVRVKTYASNKTGQDASEWVIVQFIVSEHPNLVDDVVIRNARHLSLDKLDLLKQIRKGTPLNPTLNRQAAFEIEDYYRSKGYYFATVKLAEGGESTDKRVVFNITEGPVVRVRSIDFKGNKSLASDGRLKTQIKTKKTFLRIGGVYNPALLEYDLRALEKYYRSNGHLAVRVSRELNFSPDFSSVDVIFHIHEGIAYKVKNVSVKGVKNLSPNEAAIIPKLKEGQTFKGITAEQDAQSLEDWYGWRGYKVNVLENLFYDENEPGVVHVSYQVLDEVRPPTRAGEIKIIGNRVTKDRVIRRLLGIYPGQILQYPELRLAEQTLARSNLFEMNPATGVRPTVTVIDNPYDPTSEYKDILVQVEETHTGSFMVGLGVNSNAGLVGSIVLNERNFDLFRPPTSLADIFEGRAFRGAGQEFRIEAVPGTELQRYTISWREPFVFDLPYSLGVSGYYYDRIYREYTERRVGTRVTVGHQLNRYWNVAGAVRVEGVSVDDVPFYAPPDYLSVAGNNFLVAPRIALTRDSRDSYLRPTEGSRIEGSFEQVFGDFTYPVVNLEASKYFTITERRDGSGKQVLATRAQVSWAGDDVPVFERFFAGGFRSLRGFEFRGVGPFDNGFNVGGNFMVLGSMEYQIPILASDNLYLVGFVDAGTVESDVEITDFRVAAGFGARITVPMMGPVPIALDFGFPIVKGPNDREQIFSFYIGLFR